MSNRRFWLYIPDSHKKDFVMVTACNQDGLQSLVEHLFKHSNTVLVEDTELHRISVHPKSGGLR